MSTKTHATIEDLYQVPENGKAEIVNGELVLMSPTGGKPGRAAGTLVVWDVDVLKEQVVRVYRADDPHNPAVYRRGEVAEAEPALPGRRVPVNDLLT